MLGNSDRILLKVLLGILFGILRGILLSILLRQRAPGIMLPKGSTLKTTSPSPDLPPPGILRGAWPLWIALGSGLLMGCAPAPFQVWFLPWIVLAPLWVLLSSATPLRCALLWGIGYHGLALSWIRDLHPLTWMGIPWVASLAITAGCWCFITLWGAALVVIWAWVMRRVEVHASLLRVLVGTALWCGLEALWGRGVLYWTSLSYTQSPHNLLILHLGQLSGPLTVTAALVACNGILAEAWQHWQLRDLSTTRRLLGLNLALLVSLHLIGWGLASRPLIASPETALKVGLVQGNIPTRIKLFDEGLRLSLERYVEGYENLVDQGVEAVLMPEGALPWLWINRPAENLLYRSVVARGVPAWVGTVGLRQGKVTQTLFEIDGRGEITGRYDKVKLVPLGEYIPFEAVLGRLIDRLSPLGASMLPGAPDQQMTTTFGPAVVGICYESAFADLFRQQAAKGGQFILTASNNDPYGRAMMAQHHAQDVMRAIETDRWMVRVTNTGRSGIVDPRGKTQWLSGFRTYETHAHTIYRRQAQTLYGRWGNWLTPLLLLVAGLAWLKGR